MARKVRKQLYLERRHDERLKALARETAGGRSRPSREQLYEEALASRGTRPR